MNGQGLFEAFVADEVVEIVDVDHPRSLMRTRSAETGLATLPFTGLDVVRSTLTPGRRVGIRYGEVGDAEARHSSLPQMRRGAPRIAAMRHLSPCIGTMALAAMRWYLGDGSCARALLEYARHASTDQDRVSTGGLALDLKGGVVRAELDLGGARIVGDAVHLPHAIPDVVCAAAPGRGVRLLMDHPALSGIMARAENASGAGIVTMRRDAMPVCAAIDTIQPACIAA